jgi:trehalose/maltose hydrolase-like predicted phosphorylase
MTRILSYNTWNPVEEGLREALCALGNGVFVTRGAAAWAQADGVHYPGTYLAGGYNRATSAVDGREVENEDLVNQANWLPMTFRIDGSDWFDLSDVEILEYRQELHLERGVLERRVEIIDRVGHRMVVTEIRLVHMANAHLAAQRMIIEMHDPAAIGTLEVRAGIDGGIDNQGVDRYKLLTSHHNEVVERGGHENRVWLRSRTRSSALEVAVGASVSIDGLNDAEHRVEVGEKRVDIIANGAPCARVQIDKVVALHTSIDPAGYQPVVDVHRSLEVAGGFDALLVDHERAWEALWRRSDIQLHSGDDRADTVLALHIFQMHQSFSGHSTDRDVGVPARGWHGEAYRGHIFWDEVFVLPLFDYQYPDRARAAIEYRHRRLPEAHRAAAEEGHRGAAFPWQSGSTGREENQQWHLNPRSGRWLRDVTHLQRHIGLAIAFNVWHHWKVTADHEFLHDVGAELLLSIADFFADLARWDPGRDRYVIDGVLGPDEYHTGYPDAEEPGLDNNAYTNVLTAWLLNRALTMLDQLPPLRRRELTETLGIHDEHLAHWDAVSKNLFVPFNTDGIIEQFEGYDALEEFDWHAYRDRYGDISRLDRILEAEHDTPNRYKASKQPDVVMLFYLLTADELVGVFDQLGYTFDHDDIPRNVEYYLARTSHGSTLSRVVHSWVQARSDRAASWDCYREALESDVSDIQDGTTAEGIHLGAMAGTVDMAQRGYSGLVVDGSTVRFNPRLPDEVPSLQFSIRFRTHWILRVRIDDQALTVDCEASVADPVSVAVKQESVELTAGDRHSFDLTTLKD